MIAYKTLILRVNEQWKDRLNKYGGLASQAEGREFEPRFSLILKQPLRRKSKWLFWF
jgi:hypothetical protein